MVWFISDFAVMKGWKSRDGVKNVNNKLLIFKHENSVTGVFEVADLNGMVNF